MNHAAAFNTDELLGREIIIDVTCIVEELLLSKESTQLPSPEFQKQEGDRYSRKATSSHNFLVQSKHVQRQAVEHRVWPIIWRHSPAQLAAAEAAIVLQELLLHALHDAWSIAVVGDVAAPPHRLVLVVIIFPRQPGLGPLQGGQRSV